LFKFLVFHFQQLLAARCHLELGMNLDINIHLIWHKNWDINTHLVPGMNLDINTYLVPDMNWDINTHLVLGITGILILIWYRAVAVDINIHLVQSKKCDID
jgi:hypothetical protein